ncbi:adhesion G-protein coupled receptor F3-like [Boleophthalmus pectinirostris]|uniref:adhesion G-protein coupled receptor F3-like n=1 Tax=Boleophthalmus pectinirostris TaxID=150288 RepID=UPI00242E5AE3|nr:adhesion G-protein coupled receptor F3-like [Boleophthalmus pectinirostris]
MRLVFLLIFFLLFALTNGLRVGAIRGAMGSGIYYAFGVFNSLKGLWILVFGPLYDSKILLIMCKKCRRIPDQKQEP